MGWLLFLILFTFSSSVRVQQKCRVKFSTCLQPHPNARSSALAISPSAHTTPFTVHWLWAINTRKEVMMQGRWSTVGSTTGLFRLFPVYIKHSPFPFSLYHSRKQDWAFTLNGMVVSTLNKKLVMHLYFIFSKNVKFPGVKIQRISMCPLRKGWGKWAESTKEKAFLFFFSSSLISLLQREQNESHLLMVHASSAGQRL